MPVQDGQDEHALRLDDVDEAIGADDELTKSGQLRITEPVAAIRELGKRFRGVYCELGQGPRVRPGVSGDELDSSFQVLDSRV